MDKQVGKRFRLQSELVPELLHRIQSLLPPEEAARTCVLSKSWLHAWSTIPTLRFTKSQDIDTQQQQDGNDKYINWIDKTLVRYKRDNIPLQSLDLRLRIKNQWSCSLLEEWVSSRFPKFSCLTELFLRIGVNDSVRLSGALFSCENLNVLSLKVDVFDDVSIFGPPVIKCLSLRVLELELVKISEEVLNNLLSTCKLLEKINLVFDKIENFKAIKVKNLRYLRELRLKIPAKQNILELDGVPSLSLIHCDDDDTSFDQRRHHPFPIHMNVLESVKELFFGANFANSSLLDMIKSKFPFLESLELLLWSWSDETFVITSPSLKRLTLRFIDIRQIHIQVNAPKLQYFCYSGDVVPSLLFPVIVPMHIKLNIELNYGHPIRVSSFVKIREALDLPSMFDINMVDMRWNSSRTLKIAVDDPQIRRVVACPAMNVQQLSLEILSSDQLWDFKSFFNAFFSICHPSYVKIYQDKPFEDKNSIYTLVKGAMENKTTKTHYWSNPKHVEIINPHGESNSVDFKLDWWSPDTISHRDNTGPPVQDQTEGRPKRNRRKPAKLLE